MNTRRTVAASVLLALVALPAGVVRADGEVAAPVGDGMCAAPLAAADFGDGTLAGWSEREFARGTAYRIVDDAGRRVLEGRSEGGATLLWTRARVTLDATPILEWRRRVDVPVTLARGSGPADERSRRGDDFAARVHVVADAGLAPWKARSVSRAAGRGWLQRRRGPARHFPQAMST